MRNARPSICLMASWPYAAGILVWLVLHRWLGDTVWWLALLHSFTPYFFLPLALLVPAGLLCRRTAYWAGLALPLAAFGLLYGPLFLPSVPRGSASLGPPLKVLSFNMWGFTHSEETARAILQDGIPDIVALQEVSPEMAGVLARELGEVYPYRAVSIGQRAYGVAVLSRRPLSELDSRHLDDGSGRVQVVRVATEGRPVIVYNVHLQATSVLGALEGGRSAIASEVQASFRNREEQSRRLVADVAGRSEPVIVAGDFNSTEQSEVYRILAASLTDAHRAVGWGLGHTFPAYGGNWRRLPIPRRLLRLDMVFFSDDWTALRSRAGRVHGESDHLPVLVELGWK